MKTIQYDFTSLNDVLNNYAAPDDLLVDLFGLILDFINMSTELHYSPKAIRDDISVVYLLFQELKV